MMRTHAHSDTYRPIPYDYHYDYQVGFSYLDATCVEVVETRMNTGGSVCESNTPLTGRARQTPVLKTLQLVCLVM
jgi:hypothetical protein